MGGCISVFRPRPVYVHNSKALQVKPSQSHFKDRIATRVLPLFSTQSFRQKYRFPIGVEPQDITKLDDLKFNGAILINDVPVRRLCRKTLAGLALLARLRSFRREKT